MRRIAIVDDQASIREQLRNYTERYRREAGEQFTLSTFENAELFLTNYRPEYDIVLMDIDMPGMDGLTAAHRLRAMDPSVVLMFVTNLAQYAIRGYEVSAVDFVVKPVNYDQFAYKLTRALKLTPSTERRKMLIRTEMGTVTLDRDDVTFVEVQGHNLFYHTDGAAYRVRGSLKQAEETFGELPFFTCNKCYIVNLAYVEEVRENVTVVAGEEIIVSRPKKKAFMEALAGFYNRAAL